MKLLPSLKSKKRYVVFEIISTKVFLFGEVEEAVLAALQHFLGELGVAHASPLLIKEKYKNNRFIIRVDHKYANECIAALMLIKKIKNTPVIVRSIITSGTLTKSSIYI